MGGIRWEGLGGITQKEEPQITLISQMLRGVGRFFTDEALQGTGVAAVPPGFPGLRAPDSEV